MKTTDRKTKNKGPDATKANSKATKSALAWGTAYTTAASGAIYLLDPVLGDGAIAMTDIVTNSLIIFPTAGAARGLLTWKRNKTGNSGPLPARFVKRGGKSPRRFNKAA